jgi:penicillin-binding protein A
MKGRIETLTIFFSVFFIILALYLSNLMILGHNRYAGSMKNPRSLENFRYRGEIFDRRGEALAVSRNSGNETRRVYPQKDLFSPLVGYAHMRLGKEGIEKFQDSHLNGRRLPLTIYEAFAFINGKKLHGQDVFLTLDARVQGIIRTAMGDHQGAVIVLNAQTGEILGLVSLPTYDPNMISRDWEKLKGDRNAPLMNRVIDGRYPPGSTFKILTLAAALELGYVDSTTTYRCPGYFDIGAYRIHEAHDAAHGTVNIEGALMHSCNVAFAQMGLKLGAQNLCEYAKSFKLLEPFTIDGLQVKECNFPDASELTEGGLAQSAFGQGELVLSTLHLALIASAIAGEGKMMKPRIIKGIGSRRDNQIFLTHPEVWCQPISASTANQVKNMMVQVVEKGTGYGARVPGITVAGKTGTAENPHGETHAWFVAIAPADKPEYVVAAILENAGYGGRVAAPLVGRIIEECRKLKD